MKINFFAGVITSILLLSNLNAADPANQISNQNSNAVNFEHEMIKQVIPNTKIKKYKKSQIQLL